MLRKRKRVGGELETNPPVSHGGECFKSIGSSEKIMLHC